LEDLQTATACEADQSTEVERVVALAMKTIEAVVPRITGLNRDERSPAEVEQTVEKAGQEIKRWVYRHLMQEF
jgi:hypothetical protein